MRRLERALDGSALVGRRAVVNGYVSLVGLAHQTLDKYLLQQVMTVHLDASHGISRSDIESHTYQQLDPIPDSAIATPNPLNIDRDVH